MGTNKKRRDSNLNQSKVSQQSKVSAQSKGKLKNGAHKDLYDQFMA